MIYYTSSLLRASLIALLSKAFLIVIVAILLVISLKASIVNRLAREGV